MIRGFKKNPNIKIFDPAQGSVAQQWGKVFPHHSFDSIFNILTRDIVTSRRPHCADLQIILDAGDRINGADIFLNFTAQGRTPTPENSTVLELGYRPDSQEIEIGIGFENKGDFYGRPLSQGLSRAEAYALANTVDFARQSGIRFIAPTGLRQMGPVIWAKLGLGISIRPSCEDAVKAAMIARWENIETSNPSLPKELGISVKNLIESSPPDIRGITELEGYVYNIAEPDKKVSERKKLPLSAALLMNMPENYFVSERLDLTMPLPGKMQKLLDGISSHRSAKTLR